MTTQDEITNFNSNIVSLFADQVSASIDVIENLLNARKQKLELLEPGLAQIVKSNVVLEAMQRLHSEDPAYSHALKKLVLENKKFVMTAQHVIDYEQACLRG